MKNKVKAWLLMNQNDTAYESYDAYCAFKTKDFAKQSCQKDLGEYILPITITIPSKPKKEKR